MNKSNRNDILNNLKENIAENKNSKSPKKSFSHLISELVPERFNSLLPLFLNWYGCKISRDINFTGKPLFKIDGNPNNIIIKKGVLIRDKVDIRNRDNGRIIIHENAYLDEGVRIIAARDAVVEIGQGVAISRNCTINGGGDVQIGDFSILGNNVNINATTYNIRNGSVNNFFVEHKNDISGSVKIGRDVWIGSNASIIMNTEMGEGSILGANSLLKGEVKPFSIMLGVPAKHIKFRE